MRSTAQVVEELLAAGFRLRRSYLLHLVYENVVPRPMKGPAGEYLWLPSEIERVKKVLLARGRGPVDGAR